MSTLSPVIGALRASSPAAAPGASGNLLHFAVMPFDPDVTRDEDLRAWREQFADAVPIAALIARERQTCVGVVEKIRLDPGRQLEVTVEDGSGRLTAVFSGRSNLPGLELGAALRLTGTVMPFNGHGVHMRNPTWAGVTEPYG